MRVRALPVKQRAAQLLLELLDRPRQRRPGDVASLRRAGEIQFLTDRQKVADLVHLHIGSSLTREPRGDAGMFHDRSERFIARARLPTERWRPPLHSRR